MGFDYDKVAGRYDSYRWGGGPFLARLVELARECQAGHVLEVGPGTGNNTQAFLERYPCALTALELSSGMLDVGRAKVPEARWVQGDVQRIPLADAAVEYIFGVYVLHHLRGLLQAFQECTRILGPGGVAAFVTAPLGYIERHPMNAYFPSFSKADLQRFQSVDEIVESLRGAGFEQTRVEYLVAAPKPIDSYYVERVANKFISSFDLIPEDEFQAGLARLQADVAAKGKLDVAIEWESVVVWGLKDNSIIGRMPMSQDI